MQKEPTYEELKRRVQDLEQKELERKKSHESEELYKTLFNQAAVGVAQVAPNGLFTKINSRFCQIVGYKKEELSDLTFRHITHPEDLHLDDRLITKVMADEIDSFTIEKRYIHKNGHTVWITLYSNAIRNEDRSIKYAIAVITDISDKIKAIEALKKSEQELQQTLDATADGIWSWNFKTNELYFSQNYYKILGYQPDEFSATFENWVNLIHPDDRERALTVANDFLKMKPDVYENEFRLKTKNGDYRWARTVAKVVERDKNGDAVYMIGNHEDITERKNALDAFIQERERFELAMRSVNDGLWDWNLKTNEIYYSPVWKKLLGYEDHEIENKFSEWERLTHPDDVKKSWEILNEVLEGKRRNFENEFKMLHKNGHWVDILARAEIVFDENAQGERVIGTHVDVTERKRIEKQVQQYQKMESIGSLAGGIAHDFNNLLFPIVGLSEMMLNDFSSDSLEYQNLHEIFLAGKRGRELVQQILSFSRQSEHQPIPVHIQRILKEVLKLCRATIPADISITQDIMADCGPVMADPTQIHQITMNLITNAYHAVEPVGGTISIQLKEMDVTSTNDPAGDLAPGRYAVLSVSDTGIGIDGAVIDKIFDPYFTTKEKGRGTGLGLATVYGIVKAHGGDIRVTSELGEGATFHIYFPLMEESQELEPEKEITAPLPKGKEHILLVDDEKSIIHLEKQMLGRLGYQTSAFTGSRDALTAFKTEPSRFDLVITDMNMPNMNGLQLATELIAIRPDIPIILCTGFSERIDSNKAQAQGIRGLLMKPVGMKDLSQKVREVLDAIKK